jgi:hypothetical protein
VAAANERECSLLLLKLLAVAVTTARFSDFVRQHQIHGRWNLHACLAVLFRISEKNMPPTGF